MVNNTERPLAGCLVACCSSRIIVRRSRSHIADVISDRSAELSSAYTLGVGGSGLLFADRSCDLVGREDDTSLKIAVVFGRTTAPLRISLCREET
jgi:hypothetical protein